ncbi:MAG: hypothetical protein AAF337_03775, partial [Pseudomonadota bacterium]
MMMRRYAALWAGVLGAATLSVSVHAQDMLKGEVLEAVNVGGPAMEYEGISYGADAFIPGSSKVGKMTKRKYGAL